MKPVTTIMAHPQIPLWLVCGIGPSPAYSHSDIMYSEVLITVNSILGITAMSYIKLFMKCTASGLCGERETERREIAGTQALGRVHGDKQHPALFTEARAGTPVSCDGDNVLNET